MANTSIRNSDAEALAIALLERSPQPTSHLGGAGYIGRAKASLRRSVMVYLLAGFVYALLFGIGWALQLPEGIHAWRRILALAIYHLWPAVLAVALLAATSRKDRFRFVLIYFVFIVGVSGYLLAVSPSLTVRQLIVLWLTINGPATLLILAFLRRRIRAVGPLVLAFLSISVLGAVNAPVLVFRNDRWMRTAAEISVAIKLGGAGMYYAVVITGFLLFAWLSWWLLRRFAELYRKKKLSDQSLTLDSLFFVFAVEQSITLDPSGAHIYVGLAAFLAYKIVIILGSRYFVRKGATNSPPATLLYLRVFSLGSQSEELFDGLAKLWRRIGNIAMIAGPDLIRITVEPHEFLEFLGGKMSRRFVAGRADLTRRIADLDKRPDPDGRYRVNQFFCYQDTWQMTMRTLARQSAAVLMDLRSFSPRDQGCLFELGQLLDLVHLDQVLFLIDSTTDRQFLEQTLRRLRGEMPAESPNARQPAPVARFFLERRDRPARPDLLFRELLSPAIADPIPA